MACFRDVWEQRERSLRVSYSRTLIFPSKYLPLVSLPQVQEFKLDWGVWEGRFSRRNPFQFDSSAPEDNDRRNLSPAWRVFPKNATQWAVGPWHSADGEDPIMMVSSFWEKVFYAICFDTVLFVHMASWKINFKIRKTSQILAMPSTGHMKWSYCTPRIFSFLIWKIGTLKTHVTALLWGSNDKIWDIFGT